MLKHSRLKDGGLDQRVDTKHNMLISHLTFATYLSVIFIGDFGVDGLKISPILLPLLAPLLLFLTWPKIDRLGLFLWLFFAVFLMLPILKITSDPYYLYLVPIAVFPLVYFQTKPMVQPSTFIVFGSALMLLLLAGSLIFLGGKIGTRTTVIFGPNVLYRVIATFIALTLFVPCKRGKILILLSFLATFVGAYGILLTGSKGAILELLFILFLFLAQSKIRIGIAISTAFAVIMSVDLIALPFLDIRLLRFSSDLSSISVRLDAYASVSDFLNLSISEILFGYGNFRSLTYIMPHNIYLEGLLAHGLIFTIFLVVGTASYFVFLAANIRKPEKWWFDIPLLTVFIGALVSGTYGHNYPAVCISFIGVVMLLRWLKRILKTKPIVHTNRSHFKVNRPKAVK